MRRAVETYNCNAMFYVTNQRVEDGFQFPVVSEMPSPAPPVSTTIANASGSESVSCSSVRT